MSNIKRLESGTIEITEKGYVLMKHKDNSRISLEELKRRETAIIELFNGKPHPILIDTRNRFIQYDAAARNHTDNNGVVDHLILAEAFVVDSIGIKLLIQDHVENNKGGFPIRIFTSFEEAEEWVQSFL